MKRSFLALALGIFAALLVAGCGGGSGSGSSGPEQVIEVGPAGGGPGASKKATAPNVPAGSKVVVCKESEVEARALRASAVGCGTARATMRRWQGSHACTLGESGSRSSCSLGTFRCQAVRVDGGASVSCAHPGGDITWIARSWPLKKTGAG